MAQKLRQQQEHRQRPRGLWLADQVDNLGMAIRVGMVYMAMHWVGFCFEISMVLVGYLVDVIRQVEPRDA